MDGHLCLVGQAPGQPAQESASADEMDALGDDVMGQFGWRFTQASDGGR